MKKASFSEVLDAAESLPLDAKEELLEILHKRTIDERREELVKDVRNARLEHKRGKSKIVTANSLLDEIVS